MSANNSPRSAWSGLSLGAKDFTSPPVPPLSSKDFASPPVPPLDHHAFGGNSSTLGESRELGFGGDYSNRDRDFSSAGRDHGFAGPCPLGEPVPATAVIREPVARAEPVARELLGRDASSFGGTSLGDHLRERLPLPLSSMREDQVHGASALGSPPPDQAYGGSALGSPPLDVPPLGTASLRSPSPRTPSTMVQDGPEVARRAAEWERQIESLDQKEMEIHQTQLRLIREQTATFRGDLLALRQEVLELKAHNEERAAAQGRLERRCNELGEGLGRHGQLHQDGERRGALQKQHVDKLSQELEVARSRLEQLLGTVADHHSQFSQHSTVTERIGYLEKVLGDSAEKHSQGLREAQMRLEQLQGRVAAFESSHGELKRAHAQFAGDRAEQEHHHSSMAERVSFLEKLMGDSADKHTKELADLRSQHTRHVSESKSTHASLQALVAQEREFREQHHASVQARLAGLENAVGESADRQAKEFEALKGNHTRMFGGHATVAERLAFVERQLGDSADKSAQELAAAHGRIEQLHGRLMSMDTHGSAIESLKKSFATLAKEKADLDIHHATVKERVDYLERALGDSADKHMKELEDLKAAQRMFASEGKVRDKATGDMKERLEQCMKANEKFYTHHATIEDRVNYLESVLGESVEKHNVELAQMRSAHAKHSGDAKAREAQHATFEERLKHLEKVLGDSADRHDQELRGAHAKLEQLHGRLQEERKAREAHHSTTREHLASEQGKREAHQSSMEERISYIEKALGDSADKHARELEQLRGSYARHVEQTKTYQARHGSVEERLEYIEQWFRSFKPP